MTILIVDDELVSRKTLEKLLSSIDECDSAENGEDALKIVSERRPDLILLDISMTGIDGYEVCRRLKAEPQTEAIPIIFLSAHTKVEEKTRAFGLGGVDYITKPFHKAEVKARVETHLALKKIRENFSEKNTILESQMVEIKEKTEQLRDRDLQLIEMDRTAGIGDLAAGIAHEINNPLGFLKSSFGFLLKRMNQMAEAMDYWNDKDVPAPLVKKYKDYLDEKNLIDIRDMLDKRSDRINRGIERISTIVDSLRSFSRVDLATSGRIDLNQSIEEAITIMNVENTRYVAFEKELQDVPPLPCDTLGVNQCLHHVLKNALDAVDDNGTIKIRTAYDEKEDRITIRIADDGKGMSPEVLRKACNPFFTTKEVGSGTGVGLSLTEKIIRRHGGDIDITSTEGMGTTVTMRFPATGKGAVADSKTDT